MRWRQSNIQQAPRLLDPLDQGLDAIAHVSGVQRGHAVLGFGKIVIHGAYGKYRFPVARPV